MHGCDQVYVADASKDTAQSINAAWIGSGGQVILRAALCVDPTFQLDLWLFVAFLPAPLECDRCSSLTCSVNKGRRMATS